MKARIVFTPCKKCGALVPLSRKEDHIMFHRKLEGQSSYVEFGNVYEIKAGAILFVRPEDDINVEGKVDLEIMKRKADRKDQEQQEEKRFECSCGMRFETPVELKNHQEEAHTAFDF